MQCECKKCGKIFTAKKSKTRKFCSSACWYSKYREKPKSICKCLQCGNEFRSYPNWIKRGGGKYCSQECHSVAMNEKVSKSCLLCGNEFSVKPSTLIHNASKYCSPKCSQLASRGVEKPSIQGNKAPNWHGGVWHEKYPLSFNDELKESVRKRDEYKCLLCGLTDEEHILIYSYSLNIHHVDYSKDNSSLDNLVALCGQCHGRTNYNREHWKSLFVEKLQLIK